MQWRLGGGQHMAQAQPNTLGPVSRERGVSSVVAFVGDEGRDTPELEVSPATVSFKLEVPTARLAIYQMQRKPLHEAHVGAATAKERNKPIKAGTAEDGVGDATNEPTEGRRGSIFVQAGGYEDVGMVRRSGDSGTRAIM
ncbi:hypothetical protein FRC08_000925 [Ceratobasidium sp. 394]|nr:hypothetical protein FRC08_000925 [Ceratobasidium sp. 394]